MAEVMRKDKKSYGDKIHFVLPFGVGDVRIVNMSVDQVCSLLAVR